MNSKIFTEKDSYLMLALDQRGSFRRMLNPQDPENINLQEAIKIKKEIIKTSHDIFSGILIDQDYGLPAYQSCEECQKPYLLPAEDTGYKDLDGDRITKIKYSAEEIKDMGADGVKLLIYFDSKADTSHEQIKTAKKVLEDAHSQNLPLFLEIITYNNTPVPKAVSMFLEKNVRPDVFKIEFPGGSGECQQIQEMLGTTPWILLTAGINFESFCEKLDIATKNGCGGFLAGRSLWQEYVPLKNPEEKNEFLQNVFIPRFNKVINIVKNNRS